MTASRSRRSAVEEENAASVIMTESIVAMLGAIIAAPFATPVMVTAWFAILIVREAIFGTVSVVMIARAAFSSAVGVASNCFVASMIPFWMRLCPGRCLPMTPVEQTRTFSELVLICFATSAVIACASFSPCSPVDAFALPELMTTARMESLGTRFRETCTGAPQTWLSVKTPAAVQGVSETKSARSRFLGSSFRPQWMPAVWNFSGSFFEVVMGVFLFVRFIFYRNVVGQALPLTCFYGRSPVVSGKPCMMLKFWTATPLAPLMRLSMTEKMMTFPRESRMVMSQKFVWMTSFVEGRCSTIRMNGFSL